MKNNITIIKDLGRFGKGLDGDEPALRDLLIIKTIKIRKETSCSNYHNCKNTIPKGTICVSYCQSIRKDKCSGNIEKFCSVECCKQELKRLFYRSQELTLFFDNINAIMEERASSQP